MADAEHSKCFAARRVGSTPTFGTKKNRPPNLEGLFLLLGVSRSSSVYCIADSVDSE